MIVRFDCLQDGRLLSAKIQFELRLPAIGSRFDTARNCLAVYLCWIVRISWDRVSINLTCVNHSCEIYFCVAIKLFGMKMFF